MAKIIDALADRIIDLDHVCAENNTRFEQISDIDTYGIIEREKNCNTKKATEGHLRLFTEWLKSNQELRKPEDILPSELDMHLAKFFLSIRKTKSGKENDRQYEPDTLSAIHSSIQRHLSSVKYAGDIKKDKEFAHSRNVITAKKKELKKLGKGNKTNASEPFTADELNIFWEQSELGSSELIFELFCLLRCL